MLLCVSSALGIKIPLVNLNYWRLVPLPIAPNPQTCNMEGKTEHRDKTTKPEDHPGIMKLLETGREEHTAVRGMEILV